MPANANINASAASVLRHVVLFSFKPEAGHNDIERVVADFGALRAAIPGIAAYEWGTNVSPEGLNHGFTHCFTLGFATEQDRDAYLVHPAHARFVATLGAVLERSLVLDYWTQ